MNRRLARSMAAVVGAVGLGVVAPLGCIEVGHQGEVGCLVDPNEPGCPGLHLVDASDAAKDTSIDTRRDVEASAGDGEASAGDGPAVDAVDGQPVADGGPPDGGDAQGDEADQDAASTEAGSDGASPD